MTHRSSNQQPLTSLTPPLKNANCHMLAHFPSPLSTPETHCPRNGTSPGCHTKPVTSPTPRSEAPCLAQKGGVVLEHPGDDMARPFGLSFLRGAWSREASRRRRQETRFARTPAKRKRNGGSQGGESIEASPGVFSSGFVRRSNETSHQSVKVQRSNIAIYSK